VSTEYAADVDMECALLHPVGRNDRYGHVVSKAMLGAFEFFSIISEEIWGANY